MQVNLSELSEVKGVGKKTIQRIREYKLSNEGYISEYDDSLHLDRNSVNQGDCLELMNGIPDKSVDMILADLPYGTTSCSWDSIIPLDKLWLQYERIIKDNGAIVLTASQPFTTKLINSNINLYRHEWVWNKKIAGNGILAKIQPLKIHENIVVFGKNKVKYKPIKTKSKMYYHKGGNGLPKHLGANVKVNEYKSDERYPTTIQEFKKPAHIGSNAERAKNCVHPTQKPVKLFEYLIKTYTDEGDLVLDNVAGSGTTGVACQNTNRDYILIEKEEKYIGIIRDRLAGRI